MRKRLMSPILHDRLPFDGDGLDLANLGTVEITSEDEPIPSNVRSKRERDEAGALPRLDLRLSDFCSTSRKGSNVSGWFSRKLNSSFREKLL